MICGGGGGVGSVARCVDCMMICNASFSPVLVGSHGGSGQGWVEAVPQAKFAVSRVFSPGTPPF
jgi:hypothetical protein